ncbi:MAG: hypothetical protein WA395_13720 [Nitrososphaeraceae archaeon]
MKIVLGYVDIFYLNPLYNWNESLTNLGATLARHNENIKCSGTEMNLSIWFEAFS